MKGLRGEVCLADRFGEGNEDRMLWPAGEAVVELLSPVGQSGGGLLRRARLVGQIVGPAGEGIDVGEVLPQPGGTNRLATEKFS